MFRMHSFIDFSSSLIPGAVASGLGSHGAWVGKGGGGNWFGGEEWETVTPFMMILESPMSFRLVRRRYPYCPFGSNLYMVFGIREWDG